jgi:uncharacterized protein YkwD
MPRCRPTSRPIARLLPVFLAAAALPLSVPAAGQAKSHPQRSSNPIAHIALGAAKLARSHQHAPIAHIALGTIHTNLARARHHGRRTRGHTSAVSVPAVCASADTPATSASVATMRTAVVCLVNQQRVKRGLPALAGSARLNSSAQGWTNTMVRTGQFSHGSNFSDRISATGYFWSSAGENIATGYATPRSVVTAWMASAGHCRNILSPSFADIGVGLNPSPVGSGVTDAATWTQDFGLWMGHAAPSTNVGPMNSCGTGA